MKENPLIVTRGVQNLLINNYNPSSKIPQGGILIAGRSNDLGWYSNTAFGGDFLFSFLLNKQENSGLFQYLKENSEQKRLIPWFQFNKANFDKNLKKFVKENLQNLFEDMIILKPTENPKKRNFVINYFGQNKGVYRRLEYGVSKTNVIDKAADKQIKKLMDFWTNLAKSKTMDKNKVEGKYFLQ